MNTNEILHINGRYRREYNEALDKHHLCIKIKTGKDIDYVELVYNDPYIRIEKDGNKYALWPRRVAIMEKTGNTFNNYYFSQVVEAEYSRLKYYFILHDYDGNTIQYSESGFTNNYNENDLSMFFIPYIDSDMVIEENDWLKDIVWYQIFPSSFNKTIKGIEDKLEYLKDLGFNGIYLNPIYKGLSYHKYDVIDYLDIDDDFFEKRTTKSDIEWKKYKLKVFEHFCKKAHKMGFKIMLDLSVTHCSSKNPMFLDVIKNKDKSEYFKWFKAILDNDGNLLYETFGSNVEMPKFQTELFEVRKYFAAWVIRKWMVSGVDCWRLDVANEISDSMLRTIHEEVKRPNTNSYIVGEIWHYSTEWISNYALDGVTNYAMARAILSFVCDNNHNIFKYRNDIDIIRHSYELRKLKNSMPLLDSHDTRRIRTICNNDIDKVKLALVLLLTFYGTPSIYYGTERYMEGFDDPDNRRKIEWDKDPDDNYDIYNLLKTLINIRHNNPIISNDGDFKFIDHNELLIYKREKDNKIYYVVINSKEYAIDTVLPWDYDTVNIINNDVIGKYIHMNRLGFMILYKNKE